MKTTSPPSVVSPLSRREFLKVSAAAGVGLVIGVYLPGCRPGPAATVVSTAEPAVTAQSESVATAPPPAATPQPGPTNTPTPSPTVTPAPIAALAPDLLLKIDAEGITTITATRSEMGQGIRTAIAMVIADELDADWSMVRIEQALGDPVYGDQVTGGSVSVSSHFSTWRRTGATARQLLISAAAQLWGVPAESCTTEQGWVFHSASDRKLPYGQLVHIAAGLPVPDEVALKDPQDFRIIGRPLGHWDAPAMITGQALYGSDVRLPGMLYASVTRCPVFGGQVATFDPAQARAVPGVRDVIQIDAGIAVVAEGTWAAMRGRDALQITWDEGENADQSSAGIRELLARALPTLDDAAQIDPSQPAAVYDIPFLAHATMEPMNCTADVRADRCEVWAPSQDPQQAKAIVRKITGLPPEAIRVHVPLIGGGFGRRHYPDYVAEAVQISQAVGAPVQVLWTREDDTQHDRYHPLSLTYVEAKLDNENQLAGPPRLRRYPSSFGVPTGYWRSVENFPEAFARECFLDEIAAATGQDPYEFCLARLPAEARAVVELAATKAGWGNPLPAGWGRGIAYHATFNVTPVAYVVKVSVAEDGAIRVHRVVCAVDCGQVVNPDAVAAQMEGGVVFGLTAALKAAITVENGRAQQSNFHDYPLLRMDEMPSVEVYIVPSEQKPSGIGEMGVPPIAPALANAVFAATGRRVRHLPIRPEELRA